MNTFTRGEFERLPPHKRMEMIRGGECIVVSDPPRPRMLLPANSLSRKAFDQMDQAQRLEAVRGGQVIVDCDE